MGKQLELMHDYSRILEKIGEGKAMPVVGIDMSGGK